MDKRIGSLRLMAAFFVGSLFADSVPSVALRVTDEDGNLLKEAGVSLPFLIQVEVVTDSRRNLGKPRVALPQGVEIMQYGTSNSMRTVNGVTSMRWTHQYLVRADTEGSLTLGPATLELSNGSVATSNAVTLTVGTRQISGGTQKQTGGMLVQSVSSVTPYVGQPITYSLRFYSRDDRIQLDQIQEPEFKGCKSTKLLGPFSGIENRAGQQYRYLEWRATLHPEKEGKLIIPALSANIIVPLQRQTGGFNDLFSMMSGMMGGGRSERLYSEPLVITSRSLPEYEGQQTGAIGTFTSFHAKASPAKAETGEGITFTLELVGQGNMVMIGHPKLVVPEGIKYYDANAKEQALSDTVSKKDFEYILQALQPGTYTIPEQTFAYFDPATAQYKTLTSRSVKLLITGETKKVTSMVEAPQVNAKINALDELPALEKRVVGSAQLVRKRISLPLFILILVFLASPLVAALMRSLWSRYQIAYASERLYKKAFQAARKRLKVAKARRNGAEVYHVFKQLFKERLHLQDHQFSETAVEEALRNAKLPADQLQKWRHYFSHTMAVAFSALPENIEMYEEGEQWILLLERIL